MLLFRARFKSGKESLQGSSMAKSSSIVAVAVVSFWLESISQLSVLAEEVVDFEGEVLPILEQHCQQCHGPDDQLNDLRFDSKEAILKGGSGGKVLVPGEPEKSSMYVRPSLPADDFDIMPAEGDPLTKEQVEILRRWIAAGADFGGWTG